MNALTHFPLFVAVSLGVLIRMIHVISFLIGKVFYWRSSWDPIWMMLPFERLAVLRKFSLEHFSSKFIFYFFGSPRTKSGFNRKFSISEFGFQNTKPVLSTDRCHLFLGKQFVISSFLVFFGLLWDSPFLLPYVERG